MHGQLKHVSYTYGCFGRIHFVFYFVAVVPIVYEGVSLLLSFMGCLGLSDVQLKGTEIESTFSILQFLYVHEVIHLL